MTDYEKEIIDDYVAEELILCEEYLIDGMTNGFPYKRKDYKNPSKIKKGLENEGYITVTDSVIDLVETRILRGIEVIEKNPEYSDYLQWSEYENLKEYYKLTLALVIQKIRSLGNIEAEEMDELSIELFDLREKIADITEIQSTLNYQVVDEEKQIVI